MRRRPVLSALVLAVALALPAACGDDDAPADRPDATTGGTDTAGGDTTGGAEGTGDGVDAGDAGSTGEGGNDERAADEQRAAAALLTLEDLPAGWQAEPRDEDEASQEQFNAQLASCLDVDPALLDQDNPSAQSDDFVSPEQQVVSNKVSFTPSEDAAAEVIAILDRSDTPGCFGEAVQALIADNLAELESQSGGVELGQPAVERAERLPVGDGSSGLRITIPLQVAGQQVDLFLEMHAVRVGRVGITTMFQSIGTAFDRAEAERLTSLVVERVAGVA